MKKWLMAALAVFTLTACTQKAEKSSADYPEWEYTKIKRELQRGWNTWDTRNVLTQVYSEEKTGVRVAFVAEDGTENDQIRIGLLKRDAAVLHPYDHTYDGTYSEVDATWRDLSVKVRSSAQDKNLIMLFTPLQESNSGRIKIMPGKIWPAIRTEGRSRVFEDHFEMISSFSADTLQGKILAHDLQYVSTGPDNGYYLCAADEPILITVGEARTLEEAEALVESRKDEFVKAEKAKWGDNYEIHRAMQSILAWDTVYDPSDDIVVTPVSRNWNITSTETGDVLGGYVLFDWDTYFASEMLSMDNRELAYSNAIEITMATDQCGFVPNFTCSNNHVSYDRSQPPVGSRAIWTIYERYGERWFLELLYPRLLRWNIWWTENRVAQGLLCWGSTPQNGGKHGDMRRARQMAVYESGLDNTYVYDDAEFLPDSHMANFNDVGLSAMYIMDCDYLARIADELGHSSEAKAIRARGETFRRNIQQLWSEEDGMFYCKNVKTGEFVKKMDATNFYPLLAGTATPEQADRMIREHLLNEEEFWGEWVIPCSPRNTQAFRDNNYWRGRIWGPTNFLVYLGLRNYDCPQVRADFAEKSRNLLLRDWLVKGYIYENWNATTGQGDDVGNSDRFYHWGSLLGYITLMDL